MKDFLRQSQLVMTFGPGSMLDLPNDAVIVGGLEQWAYDNDNFAIITEPRLLATVQKKFPEIQSFRAPPAAEERGHGFSPNVVAWKFPGWFVLQASEKMENGNKRRRLVPASVLDQGKFRNADGRRVSVVPVRFVRACNRGHVDDIDWQTFVHQEKPCGSTGKLWIEERGTSGTLADTFVVCDCKASRSMARAGKSPKKKKDGTYESPPLGFCTGRRPWLGPRTRETDCNDPSRLLIRSASNAYFSQFYSVISIPDHRGELVELVGKLWDTLKIVAEDSVPLSVARKMSEIGDALREYSDEEVMEAIETYQGGKGKGGNPNVKEVEFAALTRAEKELGSDVPNGDFYARALPDKQWKENCPWMHGIDRIVLVHRLREVMTQYGFTRFEAPVSNPSGELDLTLQVAKLSIEANWLPAVENRGEGIFLQFSQKAIERWMENPNLTVRGEILQGGFEDKFNGEGAPEFFGLPFYMVHSFSHLLMTQIALECGYPSGSLRERIYSLPEGMGLLIYTGSTDAEGTLGGLVQAGRKIATMIRRALQGAELCSNDPICSSQRPNPDVQRELLGSACHGCELISETSCENRNGFLDRTLVVQTMERAGAEFFKGYGV